MAKPKAKKAHKPKPHAAPKPEHHEAPAPEHKEPERPKEKKPPPPPPPKRVTAGHGFSRAAPASKPKAAPTPEHKAKPKAPKQHKVDDQPVPDAVDDSTDTSGYQISGAQQEVATTILNEGLSRNAPRVALEASMYAALGETNLGENPKTYQDNGVGYGGVLQGSVKDWPDLHDTAGMAQAFFTGTGPQGQTDFHFGAITLANQGVTDMAEIAVKVEDPSTWPDNAYTHNDASTDAALKEHASAIVDETLPGLGAPGATNPSEEQSGPDNITLPATGEFSSLLPSSDSSDLINQTWGVVADTAANVRSAALTMKQHVTQIKRIVIR